MERHEPPHGGSGAAPRPDTDDAPPDPREGLAIVAAQRRRVRDTDVDNRLMFGVWGVAWLVGYAAQWWTATTSPTHTSTGRGGLVFAAVAAVAMVITIVHVARATHGIAGTSQQVGIMYGWAWAIGFTGQGLIVAGVVGAGANPVVIAVVANGIACVVVGLLYMAGGALWREVSMYLIGAWMIVTAGAASLVPMPDGYLVMAFAGGGGMLVAAVLAALRRRRA
ncbi:hypothetical protein [Cellulomonas wangsupingiae]|uniref:Transporter n=1 Tax=Cellulomonas wangsupingiae TaxID=2968085 RepID=A0ABY5K7E1_9CELL|nr:hypothetical protein [Cellulomonas wangsupingiae]MCC2333713.1 hypothetical protein [Cellulomonas wangsupingiae]MCM0639468.1 hypothetical protein [Cellulomonas wangsupingiae]UUI64975.1 hypothetical protein NP075_17990 [Cellulomonas wangsupingiae]